MVQKHVIQLEDDIDGGTATETVTFGLDGTNYVIDLSAKNADKLRDALAVYVAHGRRSSRPAARSSAASRNGRAVRSDREQTQVIRAWARSNGHQIGDKGRIPAHILEAYEAKR